MSWVAKCTMYCMYIQILVWKYIHVHVHDIVKLCLPLLSNKKFIATDVESYDCKKVEHNKIPYFPSVMSI